MDITEALLRAAGSIGTAGLGFVAKAGWDHYRERKKQTAQTDSTKIITRADYDKKLLEIATTMTETILESLRREVADLRADLKERDLEIAGLRSEIAVLRSQLEEHQ